MPPPGRSFCLLVSLTATAGDAYAKMVAAASVLPPPGSLVKGLPVDILKQITGVMDVIQARYKKLEASAPRDAK